MQLGDSLQFIPSGLADEIRRDANGKTRQPMTVKGTVVFIHPERFFYQVEYELHGYKLRETMYFKK